MRVSGVDEDKIADNLGPDAAPEKVVTVLAEAKAAEIVPGLAADNLTDVVVVGCDSMLLIDGQLQGKPAASISPESDGPQWPDAAPLS